MKNHHDHGDHDHDHSHETDGPSRSSHDPVVLNEKPGRAFQISIVFNLIFVGIEFYYGFVSQSLSLFGDALHNLGDVFALALSWLGFYLSRTKGTDKLSFGFKKFSILAAFFNAFTLIVTSGYIIFEAIKRFQNPQAQNSLIIMAVAGVGFVINLSTALLFHKDHKHDLNIKSAYLHLLGDALVSLGVVLAGAIIYYKHWLYVDPVVSVIIAAVILAGTWGLFKESIILLMNGVPQQISYPKLSHFLKSYRGVSQLVDLKVWAVSTSEFAMTAKLKSEKESPINLEQLIHSIKSDFAIKDITIQID